MSDEQLRQLERRAAVDDDDEARARLVRELVRRGASQDAAQRRIFGRVRNDVLVWQHPKSGTYHVVRDAPNYNTWLLCGHGHRLARAVNYEAKLLGEASRIMDPVQWVSFYCISLCETCKHGIPFGGKPHGSNTNIERFQRFLKAQAVLYRLSVGFP